MPSTICQLGSFGLIITATYWLGGKPVAFLVAAVLLLVVGFALEGKTINLRKYLAVGLSRLAAVTQIKHEPEAADEKPTEEFEAA